jgi:hypothetical protein
VIPNQPAPHPPRPARSSTTALTILPLVLSIAVPGLGACDSSDGGGALLAFILVALAHSGDTNSYATSGSNTGSASTGGYVAGPKLGAPCTLGANPDPCVQEGFVCKQVGDTSSCQLPGEFERCIYYDPGCAPTIPPLFCEPDFESDGLPVSFCVYHCDYDTAECPNVFTNCQANTPDICYINYCGPGAFVVNGTAYYADCNSGGTNDGTCVPYYGSGTPGVCQAAGPVALWQPCSDLRLDGGTSDLCAKGTTCLAFPSDGGVPKTMCAPLCAPSGASVSGPSCGAGQTCFSAGSVDYGFCLTDCAGGRSCPAPTSCQDYGMFVTRPECVP